MIGHGVPVFSTGCAWANAYPFVQLRIGNVVTIGYSPSHSVYVSERVLEDSLQMGDELTTHSIVLPQNAVLAD